MGLEQPQPQLRSQSQSAVHEHDHSHRVGCLAPMAWYLDYRLSVLQRVGNGVRVKAILAVDPKPFVAIMSALSNKQVGTKPYSGPASKGNLTFPLNLPFTTKSARTLFYFSCADLRLSQA
jgi:hypothetical protein